LNLLCEKKSSGISLVSEFAHRFSLRNLISHAKLFGMYSIELFERSFI